MMRTPDSYFAKMYGGDPDPWGYESRWYEQRKYALTVAALPRRHYTRVFEPGCSNGVLTEQLATRCEALVGLELVAAVAERARSRVPAHVEIRTGRIPEQWPEGTFDLVVLSEVLYYLTEADVRDVLGLLDRSLSGHVVAVHWRGETDYPLTGDRVHELLDRHAWQRLVLHREDKFVLSVYETRI